MHPMHRPVRLRTMSWTTGQAFAMRRTTWAQNWAQRVQCVITWRYHPPPQSLNRGSGGTRHNESADLGELAQLRRSVEDMRKEQGRLEANLQAEFQLRDMLSASESSKPKAAITPLNPRWQLSSQAMHEVVRHVLLEEPKVVVECGSGGSTMWIGRALRRVGEGRLISLENSADWVVTVTGLLQREGLSVVEVRHAPLEPIQVAGHEQLWYSASALADMEGIDPLLGRWAAWANEQARAPPGRASPARQAAPRRNRHAGRLPPTRREGDTAQVAR